jgi:hypothetical protein
MKLKLLKAKDTRLLGQVYPLPPWLHDCRDATTSVFSCKRSECGIQCSTPTQPFSC